ncbi:MAG: bifunctional glutamate N-acetyltransferase/amino-acid acetyltransferase ArgJ [Acidimicrobiia bacterium]|nr:bifunctional glutamate N-acetyltransferase/amino-acid acetyltransferase ArgJ [Acidimicrobiia bacterium]
MTETGVLAPAGFVAGGTASGIKPGSVADLAIVATADRRAVPAAGVFTTNLACAAPVQVSRAHLANGEAAAIVLSSGNANAATGDQGRADATRMTELTGTGLGCAAEDVLVCSTGLIGYFMPMAALESGIPALCADLNGGAAAADAILTTDTVRKEAVATVGAGPGLVGGMAKGAAMLAPAMATMLATLTTDVQVAPDVLRVALSTAVATTFNRLLVDGSTSTNDTVLVLASGASGVSISSRAEVHAFTDAVTDVCGSLAEQMARDAEGATKFVRIIVNGAHTSEEAHRAARCVAGSQLVQCSFNGEDPYWGRILSELGASGAMFDPEAVTISYNGTTACRNGIDAGTDAATLAEVMAEPEIEVVCDLDAGQGTATMLFTDLSHAYIDENRGTS